MEVIQSNYVFYTHGDSYLGLSVVFNNIFYSFIWLNNYSNLLFDTSPNKISGQNIIWYFFQITSKNMLPIVTSLSVGWPTYFTCFWFVHSFIHWFVRRTIACYILLNSASFCIHHVLDWVYCDLVNIEFISTSAEIKRKFSVFFFRWRFLYTWFLSILRFFTCKSTEDWCDPKKLYDGCYFHTIWFKFLALVLISLNWWDQRSYFYSH